MLAARPSRLHLLVWSPLGMGIFIFLLALLPRLYYVESVKTYANTEQSGEIEMAAESLLKGGTLGNLYPIKTPFSAHVAPLYPWFLSQLYRIEGEVIPKGKHLQQRVTSFITALSFALLPLLAIVLGLPLLGGAIAGTIGALSPFFLWVETSGAWEQPYAVLFLILSTMALRITFSGASSSVIKVAGSGIATGLCFLLSPALFPPLVLIVVSLAHDSRRWFHGLCIMMIATAVVLPWTYRNYLRIGGFIPVRSNGGLELHLGNNDEATGRSFDPALVDGVTRRVKSHPFTDRAESEYLASVGEWHYMEEKGATARQWIVDHPARFFALTIERGRLLFFPPSDLWPGTSRASRVKAIWLSIVSIISLVGILFLVVRRHESRWILLWLVIAPAACYLVTHIDPRYRYVIVSFQLLSVTSAMVILAKIICRNGETKAHP